MASPSDVEECPRAEVNGVAQIYFLPFASCVLRVLDSESSSSVYFCHKREQNVGLCLFLRTFK